MRPSLTRPYKEKKLAKIEAERRSDEHYVSTPTRYYGDFDPVDGSLSHINRCAACGSVEVRSTLEWRETRYKPFS